MWKQEEYINKLKDIYLWWVIAGSTLLLLGIVLVISGCQNEYFSIDSAGLPRDIKYEYVFQFSSLKSSGHVTMAIEPCENNWRMSVKYVARGFVHKAKVIVDNQYFQILKSWNCIVAGFKTKTITTEHDDNSIKVVEKTSKDRVSVSIPLRKKRIYHSMLLPLLCSWVELDSLPKYVRVFEPGMRHLSPYNITMNKQSESAHMLSFSNDNLLVRAYYERNSHTGQYIPILIEHSVGGEDFLVLNLLEVKSEAVSMDCSF